MMDIGGLLHPGVIPLEPNTILWFEFVLNPYLLEEYLKNRTEQAVIDLCKKFIGLSLEPEKLPVEEYVELPCRKQISLKVLSLKIFAYWKWDLCKLDSKLPLQLQHTLMKITLVILKDKSSSQDISDINLHSIMNVELLNEHEIFAVSLYHRWVLHIFINRKLLPKHMLQECLPAWSVENIDSILIYITQNERLSEDVLDKLLNINREFIRCPSFNSLVPPSMHEEYDLKWDDCFVLPGKHFNCQLAYDIAICKFYREAYVEAKKYFTICRDLFVEIKKNDWFKYKEYLNIEEEKLKGYCYACAVEKDPDENLTGLLHGQFNTHYTNIINILQEDNIKREIPLGYRDMLELDLASMLSCGKFTASRDLLFQIQTLNAVRRMVDGAPFPTVYDYVGKLNITRKGSDMFLKVLRPVLNVISKSTKENIRLFLLTLFDKSDSYIVKEVISWPETKNLFTEFDLDDLKPRFSDDMVNIPDINRRQTFAKINSFGNNQLQLRLLENQIVKSYDAPDLSEAISKYLTLGNERVVNAINKWEVHMSFEGIVKALPGAFLQQFSFIILAKVKELTKIQNFGCAQDLLRSLDEEVKKHGNIAAGYTFCQLISWEILYVSIVELETKWPAKYISCNTIATRCKACLATLQQNGDVNPVPRVEVMEQIIITMLNLTEWEHILSNTYAKVFRFLELSVDIAASCADVIKFKGAKKLPISLWDKVTSSFLKGLPWHEREGVVIVPRSALIVFLLKLRDPTVINVMLSLLIRLYNLLRDEASVELHFYYINLWPSAISNVTGYNRNAIAEVLFEFVKQVLKYHPNNVQWLKLLGDLNYIYTHYAKALQYYCEALIIVSEYFTRHLTKSLIEDQIFRRMSRCCMLLQSYIQAAVLCQFTEDVDYTMAFKCLGEVNTSDAMHAYYEYIWDVNMLEYLVHLHSKRNEFYKKQQVLNMIGQVELNANNSDEIKRESIYIRKFKFLQAFAKQYVIRF